MDLQKRRLNRLRRDLEKRLTRLLIAIVMQRAERRHREEDLAGIRLAAEDVAEKLADLDEAITKG